MDSLKDILYRIEAKLEGHDRRFDAIDERFEGIDRRFEAMDGRLAAMDRRFDGLDRRLDELDVFLVGEFNTVYGHFEQMDTRLAKLELLMEQQRDDIRTLAEGFSTHHWRLDNHEARIGELERSA